MRQGLRNAVELFHEVDTVRVVVTDFHDFPGITIARRCGVRVMMRRQTRGQRAEKRDEAEG